MLGFRIFPFWLLAGGDSSPRQGEAAPLPLSTSPASHPLMEHSCFWHIHCRPPLVEIFEVAIDSRFSSSLNNHFNIKGQLVRLVSTTSSGVHCHYSSLPRCPKTLQATLLRDVARSRPRILDDQRGRSHTPNQRSADRTRVVSVFREFHKRKARPMSLFTAAALPLRSAWLLVISGDVLRRS